jgi:hypothetical protein
MREETDINLLGEYDVFDNKLRDLLAVLSTQTTPEIFAQL